LAEISREVIVANSKKRMAENSAFQQLIKENGLLRKMETEPFVVSTETMQPLVKIMQTAGDYYDEEEAPFKAGVPTYLQSFTQGTEEMKVSNEMMLKNLEINIYIKEACQIGLDLLTQ
jgi:hypothetical protein